MKILLIHTYYRQRGGEDQVFEQEYNLLCRCNEVEKIAFENKPGVSGLIQFFLSIWNVFAAGRIKKAINDFKPDIVHIHNWHFGCGPIIIRTAAKAKIPVVITLHNYRLICPSGTLLFRGKIFLDSMNVSFPRNAVKKGVYRDSKMQTFWLAFITWFHRRINTWNKVSKYIVLSEPSKELFIKSRLNVQPGKFVVKPNFVQPFTGEAIKKKDGYFLFVGRLSEEKGIGVLLGAFRNSSNKLQIAGSGPWLAEVESACNENNNISYLGSLTKQQVEEHMMKATALIFPSIWHETFGLVIIEAFSLGLPVIASNIGAAKTLVQHGYNGRHFIPGDIDSLKEQVEYWSNLTNEKLYEYQNNCLESYARHFTPAKNQELIMSIYEGTFKSR
ncbi:MAG: glycosyltransferase family 4 protein [Agriterribacter sp.]